MCEKRLPACSCKNQGHLLVIATFFTVTATAGDSNVPWHMQADSETIHAI
jgi:hypothetical protein